MVLVAIGFGEMCADNAYVEAKYTCCPDLKASPYADTK